MELCGNIWEGHDYIPYVWDTWMADPLGLLCVAEYGGRVAGLGKLSQLSPDNWWLEGLRVHPEFAGQRIASHIFEYLMDAWWRMGGGAIRLLTNSQRVKVHHLCERLGFRKLGEYNAFGAPVHTSTNPAQPADQPAAFQALTGDEAKQALDLAMRSTILALTHGLVDQIWCWGEPHLDLIEEAIGEHRAWWWRGRTGLLVFYDDFDEKGDDRHPSVQIVASPLEALPDLLLDYRQLAAHLGYERACCVAPLNTPLSHALKSTGFQPELENDLFLYEFTELTTNNTNQHE
jgi:GNAT superfamily N-acetyltransferase